MKLLRFALAFILCIGAAFSLSACMKEEDYYTKAEVDALIAELNTALASKEEACNAKISALRDEYEAKVAELEAADAENAEAIAALEAEYAEKVAELEAADALTAEALAALTTKYEKDLADLLAADEANADAIADLTATYEAKVEELEAADALTAEALAALTTKYEKDLADLLAADEANADAIASLTATYEAKVEELEAADALTAEALAALTTKYEKDLADLIAADEANADAIAALEAEYAEKVAELEATDALTAEALATLTAKYEKDLADLLANDEENADAIADLTAIYESKVSELEAADALTAEALATLTAKYEKDLADLIAADEVNADAIANLKATYEAKIAEIEAEYAEKFASVNALISALQEADLDNVRRIAILEAQMEALLSKHEHTYGTWISFSGNESVNCENRLYYRICTECNVIEWKSGSQEDHDFDSVTTPPTCTATGYDTLTCKLCGKKEIANEKTDLVAHEFNTEYSTNNSFHWLECKNCDEITGKTEHTTDDSGYCTVCDEPVGSTVGLTYALSEDENYAIVTGYTGTSTRVIIAAEYNGLPVRTIYDSAFGNCNITSVIIPDSVTSIGNYAFYGCESLTGVYINDISAWCAISFGDFNANPLNYAGNLYLNGELVTNLVIPDGVTSIGKYAFSYCTSLTSVTIPDSVTSIGAYAFRGCKSLTSVTIPDSVTSIGNYAFDGCDNLKYNEYGNAYYLGNVDNPYVVLVKAKNTDITSVTIHENTRVIYYKAFYECSSLTSVSIPDSVTSIGSSAFYECTSLTSVTIPDSVTSIGDYAFEDCTSLTSVTIPDSVTTIGNSAFYGCESLTGVYINDISAWCAISFGNVNANPLNYAGNLYLNGELVTNLVIPDGVTSIGDYAFYGCTSLTSVTIHDSVTSIGVNAFCDCTSLTSVTIPDSVTSIGNHAFFRCTSLTDITVNTNNTNYKPEMVRIGE